MASGSYSRSPKSSRSKEHKSRQRRSRSYERRREQSTSPKRYVRRPEKIPRSRKLFITNIDAQFTADEVRNQLEKAFVEYGKILDTVVKTKQGSNNSYAFIQFAEIQSATNALENMRGKMFKGKQLKVEFGKGEKKLEDRPHYNNYNKDYRSGRDERGRERGYRERDYRERSHRDQRDRRSRSHHRHNKHSGRRYESKSSSSSRQSYRRKRSNDRHKKRQHWEKDSRSPQKKPYYSRNNY